MIRQSPRLSLRAIPIPRSSSSARRTELWGRSGRELVAGDATGHLQGIAVDTAQPLDALLVIDALAFQGGTIALLDRRQVDRTGLQQHRGHVGLLGNQHRRPGMPGSELDQPAQGELVDLAAVHDEAGGEPLGPVLHRDRPQLVEAAELAQGALARREEITHQVLDRPREEHTQLGAALKDGPHPLGQPVGVPVRGARAGDLLELVKEEDDAFAVGRTNATRQRQGIIEIALGVATGKVRRKCDLHLLAELGLRLDHRRDAGCIGDQAPSLAGLVDNPPQCRAVGDRLRD